MPKLIKHESFKYGILKAATSIDIEENYSIKINWIQFLDTLKFTFSKKEVIISWKIPNDDSICFNLNDALFYKYKNKINYDKLIGFDSVKDYNSNYFISIAYQLAEKASFTPINKNDFKDENMTKDYERQFHDDWAESESIENIDVMKTNEVLTAPEMRYIIKSLGELDGKELLDIGCGLGEASVYFALKGATVTSSDLSEGMLNIASNLAKKNNVNVISHLADAEDLRLNNDQKFDIIYAGNLLHHVDIKKMINNVKPHLKQDGVFVSWDPIAYNPIINIYRALATDVRTPDEHPLKWQDIKLFNKNFDKVETRYFWFFTLIIFIAMAIVQRRNPNKERFWKVILEEGDKWRWLYKPLEFLDNIILFLFPPLRLLCWNVVIVAKK